MAARNDVPMPSKGQEAAALALTDPRTGKPVAVADVRAEVERLSRLVPRNPAAERAFLENKTEMVRKDVNLSVAQKEAAIAE